MVAFDAMETAFHADPYPTYKHLRDAVPAFWYPEMGFWLLTRYADVAAAVRDPDSFSHESFWDEPVSRHDRADERQAHVVNSFSRIMMYRDGAEHARMRRQSNRTFAPRQISESLASVERICRTLLEDCRSKGTFDYAHDFAFVLPSLVIADYLGIPTKDRSEIRELADRFSVVFEHFLPETDRAEMLVGTVALCDYLDDLIRARRKDPQDDFISLLASRDENDGGMTLEEIRGNLMHLLVAGNETTTNLLGHLIVALSEHPEVRARIQRDSDLIKPCVEEALRYEAPIQIVGRKLTRDVTMHGCDMPAGALIALVVGSANRDERRFDNPDVFDIDRPNNQHLSLGAGAHFCLGAPLARLEGAVTTRLLTTEFADLVTDPTGPPPVWKKDQLLRGYSHLRVTSSPAA
jgi:cytochrome P450